MSKRSVRPPFIRAITSMMRAVCLGAALAGAVQKCPGVVLSYEAQDLADVVSGEDLWKYTYHVSGFNFEPNHGFSVYFDETLYRDLDPNPAAPNADWSVITIQPDLVLGPGIYDALAISGGPNASLTGLFSVSFLWLGSGAPGSQPFELNQFDANGNFVGSIGSGDVALFVPGTGGGSGVPDSGANAFLLLIGVTALAGLRRAGIEKPKVVRVS